jgi:hypothetical protein
MCDDTAVRWSNYDTHRSQIEYEVRNKIYSDIKAIVDTSKLQGISNHFIAGLECAQAQVLRFETQEIEPDAKSVLF